MRFDEIPYERPDFKGALSRIEALANSVREGSVEEAAEALLGYRTLARTLKTKADYVYLRYVLDTADPFWQEEQRAHDKFTPLLAAREGLLRRALLACPHRDALERRFGEHAVWSAETREKTVVEEAIPLLERENELMRKYQAIRAGMTADYRGEAVPLAALATDKQSPDRAVRRAAYEAEGNAYEAHADALEEVYGALIAVRTELAHAMGYETFTPLAYLRMAGGYGAAEIAAFRREVKARVIPLVARLKEEQGKRLGLPHLSYWDDLALTEGLPPLPKVSGDALLRSVTGIFQEMSPEAGEVISRMEAAGAFDLMPRPGKMAGGFCGYLPDLALPFIYANFDGTAGDVRVLCHEWGHAFGYRLEDRQNPEKLPFSQMPFEILECHSMAMEFLCWPWYERIYGEPAEAVRISELIAALSFLPYGCMVDEFQLILHENPNLSRDERNQTWLRLEGEYRPWNDFGELPCYSEGKGWLGQLHIYTHPFYFIVYCLARTVSLQVFERMLEEGWDAGWALYRSLCAKSGGRGLEALLREVGLCNPFTAGALEGAVRVAERYLKDHQNALP